MQLTAYCSTMHKSLRFTIDEKNAKQTISYDNWLCVLASGSLITFIKKFSNSINVSCLHFGQKRGNFFRTVSLRILFLVFPPHIGHLTHSVVTSIKRPPLITFFSVLKTCDKLLFHFLSYTPFTGDTKKLPDFISIKVPLNSTLNISEISSGVI